MWINHPFFKYITGTILILICIYFLEKLNFFVPVTTLMGTLFYPILIAGFLYYLLKPFVRMVSKVKFVPDVGAILIVFAVIAGLLFVSIRFLADTIQKQLTNITNLPQELKGTAQETQKAIEKNDIGMLSTGQIRQKATSFLGDITQLMSDHITEIVTTLAGATTVLVIVPFVLFYFLKDGDRFVPFLLRFIPAENEGEGRKVLRNIDETLAAYIIGQITVAVVDGILMYIGYLIIGLDYALVLGIFVALTAVVPFFGPIIGAIPAIVVAMTQDPMMALYVLIILVVVQQLEGNLVAPVVLGNRLKVHPLTIILLLIVAAALYGFIGMVIAIPLYSSLKVTLKNLYQFYRLRFT
ncbi:AI-2E family transporter [Halobacillus shinanisalinarum]|uniref:AI-2E family transporter n=1 Tax=Halobacillus shinanisalinarum TaxID=2932258 RepID=A0ABY4GWI9_9BACI|nr:AI-2E family transporter [Halobacillus shinanisalinarum]UOQ92090.1 AI-2E family transporter [Halobacillus shinanisalinarum]